MVETIECGVLVVGGGTAGVAAAVTAARRGARTVLLERYPMLGGNATAGMVGALCGLYAAGPARRPVPAIVAWDLIDRLRGEGAVDRKLSRNRTFVEHYDIGRMVVALDDLAATCGVDVRLHTTMTGLRTETAAQIDTPQIDTAPTNTAQIDTVQIDTVQIDTVQIDTVEARQREQDLVITPAQVIDASGDGNVIAALGLPMDRQPAESAQGATLVFRMANVDIDTAVAQDRAAWTTRLEGLVGEGRYRLPKPTVAYWPTTRPREMNCSMTSVWGHDLLGPDITAAEREGRRQAYEYERFLRDEVPGFDAAYLSHFGWTVGVRETRRVVGEYTVTGDDLRRAATFPDGLAYSAWPIEVHTETGTRWEWLPDDRWAEIPHRAMLPAGTVNVQVVGRCLSATHEAHGSTRVMGAAMSMGEAAGLVAAVAVERGVPLRSLDIAALRTDLDRRRRG